MIDPVERAIRDAEKRAGDTLRSAARAAANRHENSFSGSETFVKELRTACDVFEATMSAFAAARRKLEAPVAVASDVL